MNYNPKFFPFYILERETLAATRYIHSIFYELHKKKKFKRKGGKKKRKENFAARPDLGRRCCRASARSRHQDKRCSLFLIFLNVHIISIMMS